MSTVELTPGLTIGPFMGSFSPNQTPAQQMRSALRTYRSRFGVPATVCLCHDRDLPALRKAAPELRYEPRPAFAAGLLYLTRDGE